MTIKSHQHIKKKTRLSFSESGHEGWQRTFYSIISTIHGYTR